MLPRPTPNNTPICKVISSLAIFHTIFEISFVIASIKLYFSAVTLDVSIVPFAFKYTTTFTYCSADTMFVILLINLAVIITVGVTGFNVCHLKSYIYGWDFTICQIVLKIKWIKLLPLCSSTRCSIVWRAQKHQSQLCFYLK